MTASGHAALWMTVVAFGIYHGLNPAMGWPLAVASGMAARRDAAVFVTLAPLGLGHLAAMAAAVLPFTLLAAYVERIDAIRIGAGVAVLAFGVYKLVDRRHPRYLARIRPTRLAWWSFVMATAHGAGMMLVPVALGLCVASDGDPAMLARPGSGFAIAFGVTIVHTLAMLVSGIAIAWLVYRFLGLMFMRRMWVDLEAVWAASLVVAGGAGIVAALWFPIHGARQGG